MGRPAGRWEHGCHEGASAVADAGTAEAGDGAGDGTREGLAAARARGRTGGRKPKLNARQAATVRRMYQATGPDGKRLHTVAEIAQAVGVHRTTVYDYLKKED